MVKKALLCILSLSLIAVLFLVFHVKTQRESDIKYLNGLLYDLDTEMDLLEYSNNNFPNDKFLKKKLTRLIVGKLFVVANTNVAIKELQGTPLKAIHRFMVYNEKNKIHFSEFGSVSQTIDKYLRRVENEIRIEIKTRDKILRDPLKKEIKERWGIER